MDNEMSDGAGAGDASQQVQDGASQEPLVESTGAPVDSTGAPGKSQEVTPPAESQESGSVEPADGGSQGESGAQDVSAGYSLSPDADADGDSADGAEGAEESAESAGDEAYEIQWPDGVEVEDGFKAITNEAASAAGLDKAAAGKYTAAVLASFQKQQQEALAAADAELKQDWGAQYNERVKACRSFMARHMRAAGLSAEDVAVLQSPKGFRLIHSFMERTGERAAAGTSRASSSAADEQWASDVMTNPQHPDYNAYHDPSDARFEQVHARFNRVRYGW